MTDEEYQSTQDQLVLLAKLANGLDLDAFLQRISIARAAGPVLDPFLYRQAADRMDDVSRLARSFQGVQKEIRRQLGDGDAVGISTDNNATE